MDQSTEAQETTEVFSEIKKKKNKKPLHTDVNRLDLRSRGRGIQTGRIPGNCQSLRMDLRDWCKEAEGREAVQAPCYFCGSPRQAAQLTQWLMEESFLALLTLPCWQLCEQESLPLEKEHGKFREVTREPTEPVSSVSNPPEHPQQPQCCLNKASGNASHSILYHFSGH